MKTVLASLGALGALTLPSGAAAHQLDSATATLWTRVLHPFSSPDHLLALVAALGIGALLFWRVRVLRGRRASGSTGRVHWRGREAYKA